MNETRLKENVRAWVPGDEPLFARLDELYQSFVTALLSLGDRPAAQPLGKAVKAMKEDFASKPEGLWNRQALPAAFFFYMPTELPRWWIPLIELLRSREALLSLSPLRIMDLGAQTGAASVATLLMLAAAGMRQKVELTLVETIPEVSDRLLEVVDLAIRISGLTVERSLVQIHPLELGDPEVPLPGIKTARGRSHSHDLILMGSQLHRATAEEMDAKEGARILEGILSRTSGAGGMIIVEPALQTVSRRLSEIRDVLNENKINILAPCLAVKGCPELQLKGGYCFHSCGVRLNSYLQQVGDLAGVRRHEINYCYLTLTNRGGALVDELAARGLPRPHARTISFPSKSRMGFMYYCCNASGLLKVHVPRWLINQEGEEVRSRRVGHSCILSLDLPDHVDPVDQVPDQG